jgi:pyridoxine 5-phosphate synthase
VTKLCVNVDHIATIRQARGGDEPDPVFAAAIAEAAGACGIVVHLRGDRRHIQDRDVEILRSTIKTNMNVEMAATEEMLKMAERIRPDQVTLVPERPGEVTTEGGLNAAALQAELETATARLQKSGILVSLFIDPDPKQIEAAAEIGAEMVEINTDAYSLADTEEGRSLTLATIQAATKKASGLGMRVAAGHGLNYRNVSRVAAIEEIEELNIGHNIIARAALVGLEIAVRDLVALIE